MRSENRLALCQADNNDNNKQEGIYSLVIGAMHHNTAVMIDWEMKCVDVSICFRVFRLVVIEGIEKIEIGQVIGFPG